MMLCQIWQKRSLNKKVLDTLFAPLRSTKTTRTDGEEKTLRKLRHFE